MPNLMCPVCKSALILQEKTWRCEHNHSYDQAKQGYVNLHVVQHKHSKNPGDTPESVQARRRFLSQGHYGKLQQRVVEILKEKQISTSLDIGCGEGYYTQAMADVVPNLVAVDIAKSAVQIAAKQDKSQKVIWVVGTGAMLPVEDSSMQMCSSLFSPLPKAEMARVLKENGEILVVTPAPKHLYAMREALFDQVNEHEPSKFIEQLQPEFELLHEEIVQDEFTLNQQDLKDLIAMTPYAYKAKAEKREALEQHSTLQLSAQFCILLFKKA